MKQHYKKLPDSELEIMRIIWQAGRPIHTGEIFQILDPKRSGRIQAVQMVLSRLGEKGFVRCEKNGRLNYYTPLVEEDKYRAQETARFIDKLYGSSPARLMAALVEGYGVSEEDLAELRNLLERGGEG